MKTMQEHLARQDNLARHFREGFAVGNVKSVAQTWENIRKLHGLTGSPRLLTPPSANSKLAKTDSWGLTLQSYHTKLSRGLRVNTCPKAGQCASVCVLNSGKGAYPTVQKARDARTEYLYEAPYSFMYQLGVELRQAIEKAEKSVTFRPNVNSDLDWEALLGADAIRETGIPWYGYTKDVYRAVRNEVVWEAYSWNENTVKERANGAPVFDCNAIAIVTDRKKGEQISPWAVRGWLAAHGRNWAFLDYEVTDGDVADDWMVGADGIIGDLSAKGKARNHRGGFVQRMYHEAN